MRQDTDVGHQLRRVDLNVEIRLRTQAFDRMTSLVGCYTDTDRAAFIQVRPETVSRARRGILGEQFMARTVAALAQHRDELARFNLEPTLDALFSVEPKPADMDKAA